jgi:hypothetical protein
VLGWDAVAGLFLTVVTTEPTTLSFDRSFSGYVGDRFIVTVNGAEQLSVSNSAGYSWTRSEVALGRGTYEIAFVLKTAAYQSGVIREGVGQSTLQVNEVLRYLRLTNLSVTGLDDVPVANNASLTLLSEASFTTGGEVRVSATLDLVATAALLYPRKLLGYNRWVTSSTLSVEAEVDRYATLLMSAQASFPIDAHVDAHLQSDTAGFVIASGATLEVEPFESQDITELIRPLKQVTLKMTRPVMAGGRPKTVLAICETEIGTAVTAGGPVGKIDPYSPDNVIPTAKVGSAATFRWLSIDAERDPATLEVTSWRPKDVYDGPAWSTPGAYRPQVDFFSLKRANRVEAVRYPAVEFDAAHLDHLNITLPTAPTNGQMTWAFVGSFTRFRGMLHDSCPILDYSSDATIDYFPAGENSATRREFPDWLDHPASSESIYLGLCSYGTGDPNTSRVAWRSNDATNGYGRSERAVITDNTPVVLIYRLNGSSSAVFITPLTANGAQGQISAVLPRPAVTAGRTGFTLGKARLGVPFDGSFLTGSMALLEVSYFNRALTDAQAKELGTFYASLYAPVTSGRVTDDLTAGRADVGTEQMIIYAGNPETAMVLITGDRAVNLELFASEDSGKAEINRFLDQGVPTVMVSNPDYASILARLEAE